MTAAGKPFRYTSFPLPDDRYRPGEGMVHPGKRAGGSPVFQLPPSSLVFACGNWRDSQHYLYAVDLFNYGYWWEAHEVLEGLWLEAGKATPVGQFLQGLIQVCAALLKRSQSVDRGARRHAVNGLAKLRLQTGVFLGVDVEDFAAQVEAYIDGGAVVPGIRLTASSAGTPR